MDYAREGRLVGHCLTGETFREAMRMVWERLNLIPTPTLKITAAIGHGEGGQIMMVFYFKHENAIRERLHMGCACVWQDGTVVIAAIDRNSINGISNALTQLFSAARRKIASGTVSVPYQYIQTEEDDVVRLIALMRSAQRLFVPIYFP